MEMENVIGLKEYIKLRNEKEELEERIKYLEGELEKKKNTWQKRHKEQFREYHRKWRAKNKDKIKEYNKKFRDTHIITYIKK